MRPSHLLLCLLLLLIALSNPTQAKTAQSSSPHPPVIGGTWTPIANLSDPHVVEVANFVVSEVGKDNPLDVELTRVIKGETQVVDGIYYQLLIEFKEGGNTKINVAIVWEKDNVKELVSLDLEH